MKNKKINYAIITLFISFIFITSFVFAIDNNEFKNTFSSNLPIVVINTHSSQIIDEPKIPADFNIYFCGENQRNFIIKDCLINSEKIGIEQRGNTSKIVPKKSYGIETWDENEEGIDISFFDFPKEEDWILYGPYVDKSLIRNDIAYKLARAMGQYSTQSQFVELFLIDNNESLTDSYNGVYGFSEKIKRDKNRVNISKLSKDCVSGNCLSGGYLFRIDNPSETDIKIVTLNGTRGYFEYPKEPNEEQIKYFSNYQNEFENTLLNNDKTLFDYIDKESFAQYFLINELTKNVEGLNYNFFISKDLNGKLKAGPVWDFDVAFGNHSYYYSWETNGWMYELIPTEHRYNLFWWDKLLEKKEFSLEVINQWKELRKNKLTNKKIEEIIDEDYALLKESSARNFELWNNFRIEELKDTNIEIEYKKNVDELKEWILLRADWMDKHISSFDTNCGNEIIEQGEDCDGTQFCTTKYCVCKPGFENNGARCLPISSIYSCAQIDNASICQNQDKGITRETVSKTVITCGEFNKCEWICNEGYYSRDNMCLKKDSVKEINYTLDGNKIILDISCNNGSIVDAILKDENNEVIYSKKIRCDQEKNTHLFDLNSNTGNINQINISGKTIKEFAVTLEQNPLETCKFSSKKIDIGLLTGIFSVAIVILFITLITHKSNKKIKVKKHKKNLKGKEIQNTQKTN